MKTFSLLKLLMLSPFHGNKSCKIREKDINDLAIRNHHLIKKHQIYRLKKIK